MKHPTPASLRLAAAEILGVAISCAAWREILQRAEQIEAGDDAPRLPERQLEAAE